MLPTPDLIFIGACILGAAICCTLRLRLVLWADTLFSFAAGGASFFYAKDGLSLATGGKAAADAQHLLLVATRSVLLLVPALTWLVGRTTVDITFRTALTLSRMVSYTGVAIVMSVEHYRSGSFTTFHLVRFLLPTCLWALIMTVQLVRTGSRVNIHIRRVDINKFLSLDLFITFIIALVEIINPPILITVLGRKEDAFHDYLHRINGCIYLGLCVIPWIGQRFRYIEDKHSILISRVVSSLVWIGGVGFGVHAKMYPLDNSLFAYLAEWGLLFLPALVAIVICTNGPFTAAYWAGSRRNVHMGGQPSVPSAPEPTQ